MNEILAMVLILLLAACGYAAGRVHGQFSYRLGFRYGYRQGYFDGDRASWNRRRRELQAAVASVMQTPPELRSEVYPVAGPVPTTYASALASQDDQTGHERDEVAGQHERSPAERSLAEVG